MSNEDWAIACVDGEKHEGKRASISMRGADSVEVLLSHDRTKLWVNTRKGCVLTLYGARGMFQFSDQRYGMANDISWQVRELIWAARYSTLDNLGLDSDWLKHIIGNVGLLNEGMKLWTFDGLIGRSREETDDA